MEERKYARLLLALPLVIVAAACGTKDPSAVPSAPSGTLSAPALDSPGDGQQLDTLRPTLTVRNSTGTGTRTYDFQLALSSNFSPVVLSKLSVPENSGGKTSWALDQDLQASALYYWRVRVVQGGTASDWSVGKFNSKVGGYNRPGELFDPLTGGFTVGERFGSTTFVPKGLRIDNGQSYVRYQLPEAVTAGEFSMEVEGLAPNGPSPKMNIFSMAAGLGSITGTAYEVMAQYRGNSGNPSNCIAFKAVFGGYQMELAFNERSANIRNLDPGTTYFWQGTWTTAGSFRLVVKEGGVNGTTIFDVTKSGATSPYAPNPHTAYLGTNSADGSFPGMVIRNVWLSAKPRPNF